MEVFTKHGSVGLSSLLRTLLASMIVCVAINSAIAGDPPSFHPTGNATIDFFGTPVAATLSTRNPVMSEAIPSDAATKKSPWLAAMFSLIVPGAGEAYAGDYVKGGAFFVSQIISVVTAVNYTQKGNQQRQINVDYANAHWSAPRYINWTLDNLGMLNPNLQTTAADYRQRIFIKGDSSLTAPPFQNVNWLQMNAMENDVGSYLGNGYSHFLFFYGTLEYYKMLGKYSQFSAGWDDGLSGPLAANNYPITYESPHFIVYSAMRAETDRLDGIAATWVAVSIVEHVLSAADAFWSAKRFNNSLHAEVNMSIIPTSDGLVPSTELTLRYSF